MKTRPTQVTLESGRTASDRVLCVTRDSISVFPGHSAVRSQAAWIATGTNLGSGQSRMIWCFAFPDELRALINAVLDANAPLQLLMDWVIEYGPANLAVEIETLQSQLMRPVS